MTDQEILEKYVDLSDPDLNAAEKKSLYNDDTPSFIRPFPIKRK